MNLANERDSSELRLSTPSYPQAVQRKRLAHCESGGVTCLLGPLFGLTFVIGVGLENEVSYAVLHVRINARS